MIIVLKIKNMERIYTDFDFIHMSQNYLDVAMRFKDQMSTWENAKKILGL